jgi:hypothetical protein
MSTSTALTPLMRWQLHILQTLPAASLGPEYASLMVADHTQSIVLAGSEVRFGRKGRIRQLANAESTMLSKHLRLARSALRST